MQVCLKVCCGGRFHAGGLISARAIDDDIVTSRNTTPAQLAIMTTPRSHDSSSSGCLVHAGGLTTALAIDSVTSSNTAGAPPQLDTITPAKTSSINLPAAQDAPAAATASALFEPERSTAICVDHAPEEAAKGPKADVTSRSITPAQLAIMTPPGSHDSSSSGCLFHAGGFISALAMDSATSSNTAPPQLDTPAERHDTPSVDVPAAQDAPADPTGSALFDSEPNAAIGVHRALEGAAKSPKAPTPTVLEDMAPLLHGGFVASRSRSSLSLGSFGIWPRR